MPRGYLRNSVEVDHSEVAVQLRYAFWSVSLPAPWARSSPGFLAFLDRTCGAETLPLEAPGVAGVVALLEAQGALSFECDSARLTLRQVREAFLPLRLQWYGRYYSHPLWELLRQGTLSDNGLTAWLVHNYHVSRSAGMTDARGALRSSSAATRLRFAQNAIDEYAHCDDFYFIRDQRIGIDDQDIKDYVPLPSSKAFDQQMLRLAEDDWLGHLLVSYFQEATIAYSAHCQRFFQTVGDAYQIHGLFRSWQDHIEIDAREGHASRLEAVLESDETVARSAVIHAFQGAWFAFEHIYTALDEILAEDRSSHVIRLRSPVRGGRLPPSTLGPASPEPSDTGQLDEVDLAFLRADLGSTLYRAMGHAEEHDEVLLFGKLIEARLGPLDPQHGLWPRSAGALALANFLRETAVRPQQLAVLLDHLVSSMTTSERRCIPIETAGVARLRTFCARDASGSDVLATKVLQLTELLASWRARRSGARARVDFFRD